MNDVHENIKEIIDATIKESLSPLMEKFLQVEPQQTKGNQQKDESKVDDGLSEAVRQYVAGVAYNSFAGKPLNETCHRFATTPEQLKNL